jgi:hypothetical protein
MEKFIKNKFFLIFTFLIVTAFTSEAVALSLELMNKPSSLLFFVGGILLVMSIMMFVFWAYMIFNQLGVLLREKKIVKKSKIKKDE